MRLPIFYVVGASSLLSLASAVQAQQLSVAGHRQLSGQELVAQARVDAPLCNAEGRRAALMTEAQLAHLIPPSQDPLYAPRPRGWTVEGRTQDGTRFEGTVEPNLPIGPLGGAQGFVGQAYDRARRQREVANAIREAAVAAEVNCLTARGWIITAQ